MVVSERIFHLGSEREHTMYEAEIVGMIPAVELLREAGGEGTMALGVDNRAAIRATNAFQSQPGHYLINTFHDDLRMLLPDRDGRKLTIRRTPGHKGIAGNEAADVCTKREARRDTSDGHLLPRSLQIRPNLPIKLLHSKANVQHEDQVRGEINNATIAIV
ncbi:uncharacterized protein HD556DRAFT_1231883 [Suillus plorans]|uniref:RNase H type-1 domain-containing protein n=1 Tax=Suillus plorans TaxID=116603 RepID=A0A9P7DMY8_9AGAM|nr:uncharacterized protein HD556DRAFT_1231883 [Suillus plorans]KAG1798858.1 hypothetical protein HD556DRAFT_1231883 [Suillus plorans]